MLSEQIFGNARETWSPWRWCDFHRSRFSQAFRSRWRTQRSLGRIPEFSHSSTRLMAIRLLFRPKSIRCSDRNMQALPLAVEAQCGLNVEYILKPAPY